MRIKPMVKCVRGLKFFFVKFINLLDFDQKMATMVKKLVQRAVSPFLF